MIFFVYFKQLNMCLFVFFILIDSRINCKFFFFLNEPGICYFCFLHELF